jgi:hypothetical protein
MTHLLRSIYMTHRYPLTTVYSLVVLTYIAVGLTLGWFPW